MRKETFGSRLFQLVAGLVIMGVALYMILRADIGLSPWDALAMAISYHVPISYGQAVQLIGAVILGMDLLLKEKIGLGTLADVLIVGWVIDLMVYWDPMPVCETVPGICIVMTAALLLLGVGQFLYMRAGLSCGPRDALTVGVAKRLRKLSVGVVQSMIMVGVAATAMVMRGPIGIGTVVVAFLAGPAAQLVFRLCRFEPRDVCHEGVFQTLEQLKTVFTRR